MSTRWTGVSTCSFIRSSRLVPPAMILAPGWADSGGGLRRRACTLVGEGLHARTARGLPDRGDDVRIGGTAADVAAHSLADFRVGQRGMRDRQVLGDVARHAGAAFRQHADGGTDLPGCAVAALEAVMLDEGGLHRMQRFAVGEAFDRGDRLAVVHDRQRQAGIDAPSVQQHGAGAALAVVAAFLSCRSSRDARATRPATWCADRAASDGDGR